MTDWTVLLVPVLVLPIVLLFRFIGCGTVLTFEDDASPSPTRYRDYIMGELKEPATHPEVVPKRENVVAYWRLVDLQVAGATADVRTDPPAKDEKGFQDGIYVTRPLVNPPADSDAPTSNFFQLGQASLIASDPTVHCRLFNGGYVVVPFKSGLYTEEFTIEAWIKVKWGITTGHEHLLFRAGGHYRPAFDPLPDEADHGFTLFADVQNRWQVRLSPNIGTVFASPPMIPNDAPTHVAFSVQNEGSGKRVRLFVEGSEAGSVAVPIYFLPNDAPLYIGVGNRVANPLNPPDPAWPIVSAVQEVVLHNKALSQAEIENHAKFK